MKYNENYLLRTNNAEITTSDGFFRTSDICEIKLNKTYHAVMVYDGKTLKFSRNGYLMRLVGCYRLLVSEYLGKKSRLATGTDTVSNCSGNDTITVFIKATSDPTFFVPNAFSPNGDGINDCFRNKNNGTVKLADITVYNRLGNLVFNSTNVNDC